MKFHYYYLTLNSGNHYPIENPEVFSINCPYCNQKVKLSPIVILKCRDNEFSAIFECPNCLKNVLASGICDCTFRTGSTALIKELKLYPNANFQASFPQEINELSPDFIEIYTQAINCLILGFNRLVGMGLRKSVEFLITDYVIKFLKTKPDKNLANRIKQLGLVETDAIFADVVRLAGNAETHYDNESNFTVDDMIYCIEILVQKLTENIKSADYLSRRKGAKKINK